MKFSFGRLFRLTALAAGLWLLADNPEAQAIPAFSQQTGQACAACHISGMGPQLTPYGRKFKLGGYAEKGQGQGFTVPLSIMADASLTHTQKDQSPQSGYQRNNNTDLDEISLFFGGRIVDHLGAFIQTTWEKDGNSYHFTWDNADIRYGQDVNWGGLDSTVGISVNNSPTVSDIYNSTPVWGYPYQSAGIAPSPSAAPLIEDGLGQRVIGSSAYGLFADTIYAEIGAYRPLGGAQQDVLGSNINDGKQLKGTAPYWRFALQQDLVKQNVSLGTFGLLADVYPDNDRSVSDKYRDFGFDATYQWLGNRKNIFTANATMVNETRKLSEADNASNHLRTYRVNGSYWYDQTYGLTLGGFKIDGSHDATAYGDNYANGRPDSMGYSMAIDWTPFGKKDSWMQPWANLQVGLQYTGYTKFNGADSYVDKDGDSHKASDNNSLILRVRTAL